MKYDFLLFEAIYWKRAHYRMDQKNLASILQTAGYKVAVVDYLQHDYHKDRDYERIPFQSKARLHRSWKSINARNPILRFIRREWNEFNKLKFFKTLLDEHHGSFSAFYAGTLSLDIFPLIFLRAFRKMPVFFWGIRSSVFNTNKFSKFSIQYYKTVLLKKYLKRHNVRVFVSSPIIKDEFIRLGKKREHIILRPERTLLNNRSRKPKLPETDYSILSIGTIREDKNIRFIIDCIKNTEVRYVIAGQAVDDYAIETDSMLNRMGNNNITRIDHFLSSSEYNQIINNAHFLVFSNYKEESVGSNGTLIEAILSNRPVIAPDYEPFYSIISDNGVGILYEYQNKASFIEAVKKAKSLGMDSFVEALKNFQAKYDINLVAEDVRKQIDCSMKC